jgi:hypothetical protein
MRDIIEIMGNTHGVFVPRDLGYAQMVLSDMQYISAENDKKNLKQDSINLLSDVENSVRKARVKLNNKHDGETTAEHAGNRQ